MSVRVLTWVFDRAPVRHRGDLLVLLVLADHARDDGTGAYPSVDTIGRKARLSRRGVFDALARLKDAGVIEADGTGPNGTVSYRVLMAEGVQPLHPCSDSTRAVTSTRGCSQQHQGGAGTAPKPSVEPSKNQTPQPPHAGERPTRPKGRRKRDLDRYERDLAAWAATRSPCPGARHGLHAEWAAMTKRLREVVDDGTFDLSRLADVHPHGVEGDTLLLGAPPARERWVAERFGRVLGASAADGFGRPLGVEIVPCAGLTAQEVV